MVGRAEEELVVAEVGDDKSMIKSKKKINKKVVLYSLLAIICLVLVFVVDWIFIAPAVFLVWLNQRELMK